MARPRPPAGRAARCCRPPRSDPGRSAGPGRPCASDRRSSRPAWRPCRSRSARRRAGRISCPGVRSGAIRPAGHDDLEGDSLERRGCACSSRSARPAPLGHARPHLRQSGRQRLVRQPDRLTHRGDLAGILDGAQSDDEAFGGHPLHVRSGLRTTPATSAKVAWSSLETQTLHALARQQLRQDVGERQRSLFTSSNSGRLDARPARSSENRWR